jgi:hypothetical protein
MQNRQVQAAKTPEKPTLLWKNACISTAANV